MNATNLGNAQFQAFLNKQTAQAPQSQTPQQANPQDVFIASIVGAEDQKACGYGGRGGGGCR